MCDTFCSIDGESILRNGKSDDDGSFTIMPSASAAAHGADVFTNHPRENNSADE